MPAPEVRLKSWWSLREAAGLTHAQLKAYRDWGLIPERPTGGWADDTVSMLICIRQMQVPKHLHRRVLVLRGLGCGDHWFHHIPVPSLRKALQDTAETIKAPVHKMRRVHKCWEDKGVMIAAPPPRERWTELIKGSELNYLGVILNTIISRIEMLSVAVRNVPYEELVTLTSIAHLNERQELTKHAR